MTSVKVSRHVLAFFFCVACLFCLGMDKPKDIHGTVVCFGDSITNGALVGEHSWVWFLSLNHPDINFINAGQNGRKTADKKQIVPLLNKYSEANYFLIFLGVNDLKNGTKADVRQCVQNMQWMIQKIKEMNPHTHIIILAPTTINLLTMAPYNVRKQYNEHTKKALVYLKRAYKKLAKRASVQFISLLHVVSPPNYVDGLHPNIAGQRQIAHAVWEGLNRLYN